VGKKGKWKAACVPRASTYSFGITALGPARPEDIPNLIKINANVNAIKAQNGHTPQSPSVSWYFILRIQLHLRSKGPLRLW